MSAGAALDDLESRIVWILGGPRTGSTWLMSLLAHPGPARFSIAINEPYLGAHLAPIATAGEHALSVYTLAQSRQGDPSYFFDERYASAWKPHLRRLILERFAAQVAVAEREHGVERPLVVIKEPNGSVGAPMMLESVPRSRAIFLIRDGRDVLDSLIDAVSPGSWLGDGPEAQEVSTSAGRLSFLRRHASLWVHRIGEVERALAQHPPELGFRVRYEDLRADPVPRLSEIVRWLGLDPETAGVPEAVASSSFEAAPAEGKGAGKALRFASPGRWREGLEPDEQEAVLEIMGPRLALLGYEV